LHQQATIIIQDCGKRNKRQGFGYESVTEPMLCRLKELVGDHYWKEANDYFMQTIQCFPNIQFIQDKQTRHDAAVSGISSEIHPAAATASVVVAKSVAVASTVSARARHLNRFFSEGGIWCFIGHI